MSLAETCYELARGDGHHALWLALVAVHHGQDATFTICPECGEGFQAEHYNSRFCSSQHRRQWFGRTDGKNAKKEQG